MSNKESSLNTKQNEEHATPAERKVSDVTITMENTNEPQLEISKNVFGENKVVTHPSQQNIHANAMDKEFYDVEIIKEKIKKDTVEEVNANTAYITMRVYETYFGRQQSHKQPHQQMLFKRPSLHYQNPEQWGGGGGTVSEPLVYERGTRSIFVRTVFAILLTMLLMTSGFIVFVMATENVKNFMRSYSMICLFTGFALLMICHYAMFMSPCTRVPPCNIIFLLLAIVAYCLLGGALTARYKTETVLYGAIATTAVVFVCFMLAWTSFDFTSWMLYVGIIATVFTAISLTIFVGSLITGQYPKPLRIVILAIGTLVQCIMLIIELQMILGGKSIELNETDYAVGAFMLYTSIMSLFMNLLQLIGIGN